jgi:phage baseplate assembly protein V
MRMRAAATAGRIFLAIARGTLTRVNDAPKMQTADVRLLHNETLAGAERFQDYGFTGVPLPGDGTGTAEVVAVFISGNRSHPIIVRVDDRRYRPKGLTPGESTLYDDQGQRVYISRSGIQILGGPSDLPVTVTVGNVTFVIANGTISATIGGNLMFQATANFVDLGGLGGTFVKTVAGTSTKVRAL